jgi:hypothetical protein
MTQHELIPMQEGTAWAEALQELPHAFHHTREYAYAMHLTTGYPTFLYHLRDGSKRLVCPLVERPFGEHVDIATPSGLSGLAGTMDWARAASHWAEFVQERGYVSGYIGIHPLFEPTGVAQLAEPHNTIYVLDLNLGDDELIRRMDANRRRQLRGWDERADGFVSDRDAIGHFMAENYGPFMRRAGAREPYLSTSALHFLCGCERSIAVATRSTRDLDAAALFGWTPHGGEFLINVATADGRPNATDLIWYGAKALMSKNLAHLNLGGGAREGDAIALAKQRYRPRRLPLRALRQVYRPDLYTELCNAAGVSRIGTAGYFPAYRDASAEVAGRAAG